MNRAQGNQPELTFQAFRDANVTRCLKWHPDGIESWSPAEWLTALVGEVGELASLLKMQQRERDGLAGNKFSPTRQMIADELADVQTYLDLLAFALGVDLAQATIAKFNAVSERVGFPDRIAHSAAQRPTPAAPGWVLVPVIPTDEMIAAAMQARDERIQQRARASGSLVIGGASAAYTFHDTYRAMVAAAPALPGEDAAGDHGD